MTESSGFATTTLGSMFWSERFASMLALRRVRRREASDLEALIERDVVETVRALGPVVTAPLGGRDCVFGRVLARRSVAGLGRPGARPLERLVVLRRVGDRGRLAARCDRRTRRTARDDEGC